MSAESDKRKLEDPQDSESNKRQKTESGAVAPSAGASSDAASHSAPASAAAGSSAPSSAPASSPAPSNGATDVKSTADGNAAPAPQAPTQPAPQAPAPQAQAPAPQPPTAGAGAMPAAPPGSTSVTPILARMSEAEKAATTLQSLCVACTCLLSYPGSAVLIRCPNCETITPRPEEAWFAPPPAPVSDLKRQASQWNLNQVLVFIQNMGLQHLAPVFQAHGVTGAQLIELTRQKITEDLQIRTETDVAGLLAVVDVLRTVPAAK